MRIEVASRQQHSINRDGIARRYRNLFTVVAGSHHRSDNYWGEHRVVAEAGFDSIRINDHPCAAGISADTALRLAADFDTTAEFWLNLQTGYDVKSRSKECREAIRKAVRSLSRQPGEYGVRLIESCGEPAVRLSISTARHGYALLVNVSCAGPVAALSPRG